MIHFESVFHGEKEYLSFSTCKFKKVIRFSIFMPVLISDLLRKSSISKWKKEIWRTNLYIRSQFKFGTCCSWFEWEIDFRFLKILLFHKDGGHLMLIIAFFVEMKAVFKYKASKTKGICLSSSTQYFSSEKTYFYNSNFNFTWCRRRFWALWTFLMSKDCWNASNSID